MFASWCCWCSRKENKPKEIGMAPLAKQNDEKLTEQNIAIFAEKALNILIPKEIVFNAQAGQREKMEGPILHFLDIRIAANLESVAFYHSLLEMVFKINGAEWKYEDGCFNIRFSMNEDLKKLFSDPNQLCLNMLTALKRPIHHYDATEKLIKQNLEMTKKHYAYTFLDGKFFAEYVTSLEKMFPQTKSALKP